MKVTAYGSISVSGGGSSSSGSSHIASTVAILLPLPLKRKTNSVTLIVEVITAYFSCILKETGSLL